MLQAMRQAMPRSQSTSYALYSTSYNDLNYYNITDLSYA